MNKKLFFMIQICLFLILQSCIAPQEAQVTHKPLNLHFADLLEREGNLKQNPNVFVVFYWPRELNFHSTLYDDNLAFPDKLTKVMEQVTRISDHVDSLDEEIYEALHEQSYVNLKRQAAECRQNPDAYSHCVEILTNFNLADDVVNELAQKNTNLKAQDLESIKVVLEGPNILEPVNWLPVGDNIDSVFRMTGSRKMIQLKNFGKLHQIYSTKNDDIVDWTETVNAMGRTLMNFSVRERAEDGEFNGYIHEFTLEKRNFLDYARYFGRVTLKKDGVVKRFGVAKIDFVYSE